MAVEPFLGEIRMFGFNFAPRGWAFCNGQILSIQQNAALFSLLGTTYGGNGTTTFGLPNLQGRVPIHQGQLAGGSAYTIGEFTGAETVNILTSNLPAHVHTVTINGSTRDGNTEVPTNAFPAAGGSYDSAGSNTTMGSQSTGSIGSNIPINNLQPLLVVNFCIALEGIFPSRN